MLYLLMLMPVSTLVSLLVAVYKYRDL